MRILYIRTSTFGQCSDRQKIDEKKYDLVIEDKCSGSIPFFEREGGKKILEFINTGGISHLGVWQIDRLGRSLIDIISVIQYLTSLKIPIEFISQGLRTIDESGKENPISKMIIGILGVVSEMERNQIKERQREGIHIAKLRGKYHGRKKNSSEDILKFLSKPKNKKALDYLKKGFKNTEISKIVGIHTNTITKIKKMSMNTL
jgi:DNA invertase Pin-like site-specific DNA recombinase